MWLWLLTEVLTEVVVLEIEISSPLIAMDGREKWGIRFLWASFFMMPPLGGASMLSSPADTTPLSADMLPLLETEDASEGAGEDAMAALRFSDSRVQTASLSL